MHDLFRQIVELRLHAFQYRPRNNTAQSPAANIIIFVRTKMIGGLDKFPLDAHKRVHIAHACSMTSYTSLLLKALVCQVWICRSCLASTSSQSIYIWKDTGHNARKRSQQLESRDRLRPDRPKIEV